MNIIFWSIISILFFGGILVSIISCCNQGYRGYNDSYPGFWTGAAWSNVRGMYGRVRISNIEIIYEILWWFKNDHGIRNYKR